MREQRAASQILFGFLPEQTVDLRGRVWKVREWQYPLRLTVDDSVLRRELVKQSMPWSAAGMDGQYVEDLMRKRPVSVLSLNRENGVRVDPYPKVWMCRSCKRIPKKEDKSCACGRRSFGQLPFVGYCDRCGAIREPWAPRCKAHDELRVIFPGTTSASEIIFDCPTCKKILSKGFGMRKCQCGDGRVIFNVHRAASVYTPRNIVIVNPASPVKIRRLTQAGGPPRALSWVVDGMVTRSVEEVGVTSQSVEEQLMASGLSRDLVEKMIKSAEESGELEATASGFGLPGDRRHAAEQEAVTIAMAVSESRVRIAELADAVPAGSERKKLYQDDYPLALEKAGLESMELVDKFPVLTGCFGYTRGSATPGASRLVPFRDRRNEYVVYAEDGLTEALFVRLQPERVATWLRERGHYLESWSDDRSARLSILRAAEIPDQPTESGGSEVGRDLLTLVHSYSHRFIRLVATHAGIERNSLSELVLPLHAGFFIYAAARGDFVLGGLQAVFETDLSRLLAEIRNGDHRCPLDPGCKRAGGACMACLHVGEPSCRFFNGFLDRSVLSGQGGFLA